MNGEGRDENIQSIAYTILILCYSKLSFGSQTVNTWKMCVIRRNECLHDPEYLIYPEACICQPQLTKTGLRSWSDAEFPFEPST